MNELAIVVLVLTLPLAGAAILAAGVWLRHRYIRPEVPACPLRKGNPWVPPAANEEEQE